MVVVLQNSFRCLNTRNSPSLYVIRFEPDGVEFKYLLHACEADDWSSLGFAPAILGIRRVKDSPQDLLVLCGPDGSGGFAQVRSIKLEGDEKFRPTTIAEFSHDRSYRLDSNEGFFAYNENIAGKKTASIIRLK